MKHITYISGFGTSEGPVLGLILMFFFAAVAIGFVVTLYWFIRYFRVYVQRKDPSLNDSQRAASPDLLDVFLSGGFLGSLISSYRRKKRLEGQSNIDKMSLTSQPLVSGLEDPIPSAKKFYASLFVIKLLLCAVLATICLALVYFKTS